MTKELELWQFIAKRLKNGEAVMLLVVADSSGSSPGRAGYKMAVAADGKLSGSIGGGVMEVNLVEQSRIILDTETRRCRDAATSEPGAAATGFRDSAIKEQVHKKHSPNSSGMICSGKQTVIFKQLDADDLVTVKAAISALKDRRPDILFVSSDMFEILVAGSDVEDMDFRFEKRSRTNFIFIEKLGPTNILYIVGGGHCALALSELISKMDFRIRIFDDRSELNTIEKNRFADEITIINHYERIGELIPSGSHVYVVVMTLGYKSDAIVIRALLDKELKYFGVLGSKAKMKTLLSSLAKDGISKEKFERIHTPIGLAINSRTPEEIAVSIAAEMISVKNS